MPILVDFETVPQMFTRLAQRNDGLGKTVLRHVDRNSGAWVDISWETFRDRVNSMAGYLYGKGIRPGDRVAILSENRPEWAYTDMATQILGAVNVSLYTSLPPREVSYIIHDSGTTVFVVSTTLQLRKAVQIYDGCPSLKTVVSMNPLAGDEPDYVEFFDDALESGAALYAEFREAIESLRSAVTPSDLSALIYTSGTTGNPKGVMLTHHNFCSNLKAAVKRLPFEEGGRHLSFLPLCHSFERIGGYLGTLATGLTISYARSIDTVTRDIVDVQPTILLAVPRLYEKIHTAVMKSVEEGSAAKKKIFSWAFRVGYRRNRRRADGGSVGPVLAAQYALATKLVFGKLREKLGGHLDFGVSGGAALPKAIGEFFFSAGIPVIEGYGLTETSPVLTLTPFESPRYGAVGHVLDGVTIGIQDLGDGRMLGSLAGEDYPSDLSTEPGEIVARGPNIMKGYWNNEEATREAIDPDGWYHTGDVGRFEGGFLVITDRIKHMIVSAGGKNIYPGPIEEGYKHEPWIDQISVIGEGREFLTALVVPDMDAIRAYAKERGLTGSDDELLAHADVVKVFDQLFRSYAREAAAPEKIRGFRFVKEPFSVENGMMTPTLKLKRKVIQERFADLIEEMYAERG